MKHFWMGAGILGVLLVLCIGITCSMEAIHQPISRKLIEAADAALKEDWDTAESAATDAHTLWRKNWMLTASVADHTPMDEIDGLFAQLSVFASEKEAVHFASTCNQLSKLVDSMHGAHNPGWWNFL